MNLFKGIIKGDLKVFSCSAICEAITFSLDSSPKYLTVLRSGADCIDKEHWVDIDYFSKEIDKILLHYRILTLQKVFILHNNIIIFDNTLGDSVYSKFTGILNLRTEGIDRTFRNMLKNL